MGRALPADLRAAAALGGEMGRRFAELDWADHPMDDPADPERTVTIEAFATPDGITVTVSDTGHWTAGSAAGVPADGGYGRTLIHGLADDVQTERSTLGTRITITCRVPHAKPSTQEA